MALFKTLRQVICKIRIEALTILTKYNIAVINWKNIKETNQQELQEIIYDYADQNKNS